MIKLKYFVDCRNIYGNYFHDIWLKTAWSNATFRQMLLFVKPDVWSNFGRKNRRTDSVSKIRRIFVEILKGAKTTVT